MSVTAKATVFLEDSSGAGWSESFYSVDADLDTIRTNLESLVPLLMAMRPPSVSATWARVSDVTVKGDALIAGLTYPVAGTYVMGSDVTQVEPGAGLLVQLFSSAVAKGRWFLRGLPSEVMDGRDYTPGAAFSTAFDAVSGFLVGGTWVIRTKNPSPPPDFNYPVIMNMAVIRGTTRRVGRPFGLPRGRR